MDSIDRYDLGGTIYQSVLLTGVSTIFAAALNKMLKVQFGKLGNFTFEDIIKVSGVVTLSNIGLDYAYDNGILPKNPFKK
jgi:hypothetical protein